MTTLSIPVTLRDLLGKLEFIGMIERGKKPCMNTMSFVDANSWAGSFYRMLTRENKRSVLLHVNLVVDQAVQAISDYAGTDFAALVLEGLSKATVGISNLIATYQKYPDFVSEIRVTLCNIHIQLARNRSLLKGRALPAPPPAFAPTPSAGSSLPARADGFPALPPSLPSLPSSLPTIPPGPRPGSSPDERQ